ncbi:MAG: DUF5110 domain-containing protein [Sphingomonadales bacterium]|nr:DUF5110 domain-containing protein [Sphingomonadales bacterium]
MELVVDNGCASLAIRALSETILRVRLWTGTAPEDASWAVPADIRAKRATVRTTAMTLSTADLTATVDPLTLALTVRDKSGRVVHADAAAPRLAESGFSLAKALHDNERIHGLGDKTGTFDKRDSSFSMWNTDTWGYGTATDPTYKSIPFYLADGGEAGCHGLFLDNTWRTWFDFAHRRDNVIEIAADVGPCDYYLIHGPTMAEVVRGYAWLTGTAPQPPRWALGYQQCRWSYETQAEVRAVVDRFRAERIPLDVIWLDIHFQDRNRPFTVDTAAFPDLAGMVDELRREGVRTVAITDLHIAEARGEGYGPYDSGLTQDRFLRCSDGSVYVGEVWPGPSVFPEFGEAETRAWWGALYRDFAAMGIAGFWNDMNEPAIFAYPSKTMPANVEHRIDSDDFAPRVASHAEMHNVYGMLNTRATAQGLATLQPDKRPFVMTRATYAGGQRYAVTWTGDNNASWEHLRLSIVQLLGLSLSGFAWCGCDIGGFTGGPSPELLTRWLQIGAFMPIMRAHAANGTPRAEPWVDGPEHTAMRRAAIEGRYRLLPYIAALADAAERLGDPILRPLAYDYPEAARSTEVDLACCFTLGRALMIAASPRPDSPQPYVVCLPAGGWFDFHSGRKIVADSTNADGTHDLVTEIPRLDRLPVFVRAGSIIPCGPVVQSTAAAPLPELTLRIYPGADGDGTLYDDDGETLAYRTGAFFRQKAEWDDGTLTLRLQAPDGRRQPYWTNRKVALHGQSLPRQATCNGAAVVAAYDERTGVIAVELPGTGPVELRFSPSPD